MFLDFIHILLAFFVLFSARYPNLTVAALLTERGFELKQMYIFPLARFPSFDDLIQRPD